MLLSDMIWFREEKVVWKSELHCLVEFITKLAPSIRPEQKKNYQKNERCMVSDASGLTWRAKSWRILSKKLKNVSNTTTTSRETLLTSGDRELHPKVQQGIRLRHILKFSSEIQFLLWNFIDIAYQNNAHD